MLISKHLNAVTMGGTKTKTRFAWKMNAVQTNVFSRQYKEETGTDDGVEAQYYLTLKCRSPRHCYKHDVRRTLHYGASSSFRKEFRLIITGLYHTILMFCEFLHVISIRRYVFPYNHIQLFLQLFFQRTRSFNDPSETKQ